MTPRDARALLFDVKKACQLIVKFTSGLRFDEYTTDLKTRSAVERQLEIVGEAVNQLIKQFPEMREELPDAPRIVALRNHLIHGYASVSNRVIWGVLETDLPSLSARVDALLGENA